MRNLCNVAQRGELGRLERLAKLYARGEVPQVDWLDEMAFRVRDGLYWAGLQVQGARCGVVGRFARATIAAVRRSYLYRQVRVAKHFLHATYKKAAVHMPAVLRPSTVDMPECCCRSRWGGDHFCNHPLRSACIVKQRHCCPLLPRRKSRSCRQRMRGPASRPASCSCW